MKNPNSGVILIFTLVIMLVVTFLVVGLIGYAGVQIKSHRQAVQRQIALDLAEGGVELAIWKLNNQFGYSGETNTAYGSGVYTVTISAASGSSKLIKVDSYIPNATNPVAHRSVQVTAVLGTTNVGFNYGVQVGAGGIKMDNNSIINGNIYSNGNIIGDNNGVAIRGTAIAAGATGKIDEIDDIDGNAAAHFLEDISNVDGNTESYSLLRTDVNGNAISTSISNCDIDGGAIYDTRTSCTVDGTAVTPNPNDFVDPEPEDLPITDEQVADWQEQATDGGTIGSQTINGAATLGPIKIDGDLVLINGAVLSLTGTVWVTGQVILNQGATLKLAAGYGALSGVLLAGISGSSTAGYIDSQNGAAILGSGTAGSYLALVSLRDNVTDLAINVANTAAGAIFYAGKGVIDVSNSATSKELTGYKVHLNQNAVITYEAGLSSTLFGTGSGAGWEIADQTWQLLQ